MTKPPYNTALITGASSGLGRGLALWFAARGVKVFGAARREDQLASLGEEIASAGGAFEAIRMDVARARETVAQIQALDERVGGLDLIVANAGVAIDTRAKKLKWDDVERIIEVNVLGAAATLSAVLPQMIERGRGHLVGVSSMAAFRGLPRVSAYSASKAFLTTFCEGIRVDVQGTGVRVTAIHPGYVKSELTSRNKFKMPFLQETDAAVEKMGNAILRGAAEYAFPWQLSSALTVAKFMPPAVWNAAAKKLR